MTQELVDLRTSILEGRYPDALAIIDELEGMSKQAILRNIQSGLLRILIHLIKNQVEQRLTNSWATSIRSSLREIQKLNLKDNKTSYYVKQQEWQEMLEVEFEEAIREASEEVLEGEYSPDELLERVNQEEAIATAQSLLNLTYLHSAKELPAMIDKSLTRLVGGKDWNAGKWRKK